jgi:hypothetical protein
VTAGDGAAQGVPEWDMPPPPAASAASPMPQSENGAAGFGDSLDPPVLPPEDAGADSDPDETHWRETYDQFVELKAQLGEPADRLSFEKFAAKLKKNRSELVAKHNCKGVRFSVYEKDGKAAIKASAIR